MGNMKLQPFHLNMLKTLLICFGTQAFTSTRASEVLERPKRSVAAYLAMFVTEGHLWRTGYGTYCAVEPTQLVRREPSPVAEVRVEPDLAPAKPVPSSRTITTGDQAFDYLRAYGVDVVPFGQLYLLDGRMRITEEQIVLIANKRRLRVPHIVKWRSRLSLMEPGKIDPPTPRQMMGRR